MSKEHVLYKCLCLPRVKLNRAAVGAGGCDPDCLRRDRFGQMEGKAHPWGGYLNTLSPEMDGDEWLLTFSSHKTLKDAHKAAW